MKIRSKLSWTFILLLTVGIMSICSYAIVSIKQYLEKEGVVELEQDTRWLAVTVSNLPPNKKFTVHFDEAAETSGYQLVLYDSTGGLIHAHPQKVGVASKLPANQQQIIKSRKKIPWIPRHENSKKLVSFIYLPESINQARYIRVSQFKNQIYAPIKTIRWKIYYGIFISIGLVVIVSIWMGQYLTRPITQIKNAAQNIADGDVDQEIDLNRNDEFGALADSLNQMALKLRRDTQQIKHYAERQRQFFADITHEIRNPLHTISGALEMLELENIDSGKKEKYIRIAKKQAERISHLFKDLKTLQRFDSDEYFIEVEKFDLSHIAAHIVEWYGEGAEQKGIDLHVDQHPCRVTGDPGKIEQVIDNLISNAIKYTNEGAVRLSYEQSNGLVNISIKDSGIGISDEHLDRLFDRFYRTDKARSRDKGGTGLGLAVVKSILKAHGTDIEVESKVNKGTVFQFQLPCAT